MWLPRQLDRVEERALAGVRDVGLVQDRARLQRVGGAAARGVARVIARVVGGVAEVVAGVVVTRVVALVERAVVGTRIVVGAGVVSGIGIVGGVVAQAGVVARHDLLVRVRVDPAVVLGVRVVARAVVLPRVVAAVDVGVVVDRSAERRAAEQAHGERRAVEGDDLACALVAVLHAVTVAVGVNRIGARVVL